MAKTKGSTAGSAGPKISAAQGAGLSGANRRERKEEARRQREAIRRKIARRHYYRVLGAVVAALLVIGAIVFFATRPKEKVAAGELPGLITTTNTTLWAANTDELGARVEALGLPALTASEGAVIHIHQHLQITIDGRDVAIPQDIGIDQARQQLAAIHTHSADGVIHVESPVSRTFTLGEVFGVWGLKFTPTSIGGYHDGGGKTLEVFVDGQRYQGDPTKLALKNHQVILVTFGTTSEVPIPLPSTFDFPNSTAGG